MGKRRRALTANDDAVLTAQQIAVRERWLQAFNLHVPWMQEWAGRAIGLLSDWFDVHGTDDPHISIGDLITSGAEEDGCGFPQPYIAHAVSRLEGGKFFEEWDDVYEPPPNPIHETREDFLSRMEVAWERRGKTIDGGPTKRKARLHAEWFVRVRVGGETLEQILEENPEGGNPRTIELALERFSAIIDLPRRLSAQ
jgi:hypothetical protein